MDRLQWLQARKSGIGGSDAPAVAGVSPWGTPLDIYLSKTRPVRDDADDVSEAMTMGHVMEPVIARLYAKEFGVSLRKPLLILRHAQLDWMFASLDYVHAEGGVIVECKNTTDRDGWGEPGTDQVPLNYLIQVQHQMEVADVDEAHLAVLFFGRDFEVYVVGRDDEVGAMLVDIEQRFWQHVERRIPPEPDWTHPNTPALVGRLNRRVEELSVALGADAAELAERCQAFAEMKAAAEEQHKLAKARLQALMGDAGAATLPNGMTLTRKLVERAAYTVQAASYVDFRIKQPSTRQVKGKERKAVPHEQ